MFYIFLPTILAFDVTFSDINMTEYGNLSKTDIIVMQSSQEHFVVEILNSQANSTFNYTNVTFPDCPQLKVKTAQDYITSNSATIGAQFCPVSNWAPLYQPVHFYLSRDTIDMATYSNSDTFISTINQAIPGTNIQCYSIFPFQNEPAFIVDCNITGLKTFVIYDLIINVDRQIVNFAYSSSQLYSYSNTSIDDYMNACNYRYTIAFKYIDRKAENSLADAYIQYCFNSTLGFVIIDSKQIINGNMVLDGYVPPNPEQFGCPSYPVGEITINPQLKSYNNQTWNIGLLFEKSNGICKCQYSSSEQGTPEFVCSYSRQQLLESTYYRAVHTVDDQLVLLTATNTAIHISYLNDAYDNPDQYGIAYKQIFQENYSIIDSSITESFINVIISQDSQSNRDKFIEYCLSGHSYTSQKTNILKVFQRNPYATQPYYQMQISDDVVLISNLNFIEYGNYFYYLKPTEIVQIYLFGKSIQFNYESDEQAFCGGPQSPLQQEYYPIIVQFLEQGMTRTLNRYIIICLLSNDYSVPKLVSNFYYLNQDNITTLDECPRGAKMIQPEYFTSQIDLLDGIMGPLLEFNYIPYPQKSLFYPYYFNYYDQVTINPEIGFNLVYKLYYGSISNNFNTNKQFSNMNITISSLINPNIILQYTCPIAEQKQKKKEKLERLELAINECTHELVRNAPFLAQVDYFYKSMNLQFLAQYNTSEVFVCQINNQECIQLKLNLDDTIRKIIILQGARLQNLEYYEISILLNSSLNFYQFYVKDANLPTYSVSDPEIFNQQSEQIIDFRYTFISQRVLLVYYSDLTFKLFTKGPTDSLKTPIIQNFTTVSSQMRITSCDGYQDIGIELIQDGNNDREQKFLIFWCVIDQTSIIMQYQIFANNLLHFWRVVPLYGKQIDGSKSFKHSQSCIYVPIVSDSLEYSSYYIYNIYDYSSRMLRQQVQIDSFRSEVDLYSIDNQIDGYLNENLVSYMLVINSFETFLLYLNSRARFVFKLQDSFYNNLSNFNEFIIGVSNRNSSINLFRVYNIDYELVYSEANITANNGTNYKISNIVLTNNTGFYTSVLYINQTIFGGPIAAYTAQSSDPDITIIPGQYYQANKFLGNYIQTVDQLGQVVSLLALGNAQYLEIFNQSEQITNIESYRELLIVLTKTHLIFLQVQSLKFNSEQANCEYIIYNQTLQNNSDWCSIRIIIDYPINRFANRYEYCKMLLIQVDIILIQCLKNNVPVHTHMIQYQYTPEINVVEIINRYEQDVQQSYLFLIENTESFQFAMNNYLVIKETFADTNSYYGIYQLQLNKTTQKFTYIQQLILPQNSQPFNLSHSFSTSLYNDTVNTELSLLLLILQPLGISIYQINMTAFVIMQINYVAFFNLDKLDTHNFFTDMLIDLYDVRHIQVLIPINIYPNISLLVSGIHFAYESKIDMSVPSIEFNHLFRSYFMCGNYFSKPQFLLGNKLHIQYMVQICPAYLFNYQSIFEEMVDLFGFQNQNLLFIQLFYRSFNNISYPVQILEPVLIDPEDLIFERYCLYRQAYNTSNGIEYQGHILISNNTYFLLDYYLYPDQTYVLLYPENKSSQEVIINVQAENVYKSKEISFSMIMPTQSQFYNNEAWFYVILIITLFLVLLGIIYALRQYSNANQLELRNQYRLESSKISLNEDSEMELQSKRKMSTNKLYSEIIQSVFQTDN